jgi:hypothetical protein
MEAPKRLLSRIEAAPKPMPKETYPKKVRYFLDGSKRINFFIDEDGEIGFATTEGIYVNLYGIEDDDVSRKVLIAIITHEELEFAILKELEGKDLEAWEWEPLLVEIGNYIGQWGGWM